MLTVKEDGFSGGSRYSLVDTYLVDLEGPESFWLLQMWKECIMADMVDNSIANVEWWKAAGVRAIKTVAQTAVAIIGTNAIGVTEVDWVGVASGAALAGIVSLLTSVAGLPELKS